MALPSYQCLVRDESLGLVRKRLRFLATDNGGGVEALPAGRAGTDEKGDAKDGVLPMRGAFGTRSKSHDFLVTEAETLMLRSSELPAFLSR